MREKKKEYGFSYGEIAKRSGLPLGTVQKVLGGFTKSPRRETLIALAGFLLPDHDLFLEHVHNSGTISDPVKSLQESRRQYHYTVPRGGGLFI